MNWNRLPAAIFPLTVAASLATFAAPASAAPTACELLTESMAASLIGSPATRSESKDVLRPPDSSCSYQTQNEEHGIHIYVEPWSDLDLIAKSFTKKVRGLGDEAYVNEDCELYVRKGRQGLEINIFGRADTDSRCARAKSAAKTLLPLL